MGASESKEAKAVKKEFRIKRSQSYNLGSLSESAKDPTHGVGWRTVGTKSGIEVWIADGDVDDVAAWPEDAYGRFTDGDTFVVLRTHKKGTYALHVWVGARSTDDEIAVARRAAAHIDRHLVRAVPSALVTLYYERQGNESAAFRSYWTPPMAVLMGGVLGESRPLRRKRRKRKPGQKKDDEKKRSEEEKKKDSQPRLFRVRAGDSTAIQELPPQAKWLNHGDAFVLSAGMRIMQFYGKDSNERERLRAAEVARQMADDFAAAYEGSQVGTSTVQGYEADGEDTKEFWNLLGGKPAKGIADFAPDSKPLKKTKVFRVDEGAGNEVKFEKVGEAETFDQSPLCASGVFVVDVGVAVFAWVGTDASELARTTAVNYASQYFDSKGKDPTAFCARVMQGGEPEMYGTIFVGEPAPSDDAELSVSGDAPAADA